MQRHLALLRHAKSSWNHPELDDHARPLSGRGRRAAPAMGALLRRHLPAPDRVYCSDATRTRETLELLDLDDVPTVIDHRLYLADSDELLDVLRGAPDRATTVVLIGHNPGLHDLALRLTGRAADQADLRRLRAKLPTAGLVELRLDLPDWRSLRPGGAELVRFVAPKDLPGAQEHRL